MAIDRMPPRLLDLISSGNWPQQIVPSNPHTQPKQSLVPKAKLDDLGSNYALAVHGLGNLVAKRNPKVRKQIISWLTSEAIEQGPYADLPESVKEQLREKITDLLLAAPDILA